jgi:putative ABC transport system ATP-binding protein
MGDLFAFDRVTMSFAGAPALDDVSAQLPQGKLSVVAGTSGSGKSSLLRLCNRLEIPGSGTVWFRGASLSSMDPLRLRRRVGMVFQQPTVFPGTVRENLLVADGDLSEAMLGDMLATAELDPGFLNRTGDNLSGGEAQRVCLARALACRPEVLLMDEPTASLHPAVSLALEATVKTLCRDHGVDVVWVTHDPAQIDRLAEHLLILSRGRVVYNGAPGTPDAKPALDALTTGAGD